MPSETREWPVPQNQESSTRSSQNLQTPKITANIRVVQLINKLRKGSTRVPQMAKKEASIKTTPENSEKQKALTSVLSQIERSFGKGAIPIGRRYPDEGTRPSLQAL